MLGLPSSRGPFRPLALVCCSFVVLQACGGRSDTEDYLDFYDVGVAGSGASNAGASATTGGSRPGVAGSSTGAGMSSVGGAVTQGGQPSVGGMSLGGASLGGSAAGVGQGGLGQAGTASGGTGPFIPVACGAQTCNAVDETCCATLGGLGCIPQGQDCSGATLNCSSSADCTDGQVCCLRIIGEVNASSQCKDECVGMGPARERRLCAIDADCGGNRPKCRDTTFGVKVCTRP